MVTPTPGPQKNRVWVPIGERQPLEPGRYVVLIARPEAPTDVDACAMTWLGGWQEPGAGWLFGFHITHWTELPPIPGPELEKIEGIGIPATGEAATRAPGTATRAPGTAAGGHLAADATAAAQILTELAATCTASPAPSPAELMAAVAARGTAAELLRIATGAPPLPHPPGKGTVGPLQIGRPPRASLLGTYSSPLPPISRPGSANNPTAAANV